MSYTHVTLAKRGGNRYWGSRLQALWVALYRGPVPPTMHRVQRESHNLVAVKRAGVSHGSLAAYSV